ncbi:MAG: hypothetical protein GQ565_04500 [Candidatus Aegiribacteria sp.]|nr:hypothetical protein [Candidatus Aegiribacteria sp.]
MTRRKAILCTVYCVLFLSASAGAQIEISGPQSGILGPGTYLVVGDISVQSGDSLEIVPGTTFIHNGDASNFKWLISGKFTAAGVEADSIYFLSQNSVGVWERWGGLLFLSGAPAAIIDYCVVDGGMAHYQATGDNDAVVYINSGSSLTLTHSRVSNNTSNMEGGGVAANNTVLLIDSCLIVNNIQLAKGKGVGVKIVECSDSSILNSVIAYNQSALGGT